MSNVRKMLSERDCENFLWYEQPFRWRWMDDIAIRKQKVTSPEKRERLNLNSPAVCMLAAQ